MPLSLTLNLSTTFSSICIADLEQVNICCTHKIVNKSYNHIKTPIDVTMVLKAKKMTHNLKRFLLFFVDGFNFG